MSSLCYWGLSLGSQASSQWMNVSEWLLASACPKPFSHMFRDVRRVAIRLLPGLCIHTSTRRKTDDVRRLCVHTCQEIINVVLLSSWECSKQGMMPFSTVVYDTKLVDKWDNSLNVTVVNALTSIPHLFNHARNRTKQIQVQIHWRNYETSAFSRLFHSHSIHIISSLCLLQNPLDDLLTHHSPPEIVLGSPQDILRVTMCSVLLKKCMCEWALSGFVIDWLSSTDFPNLHPKSPVANGDRK